MAARLFRPPKDSRTDARPLGELPNAPAEQPPRAPDLGSFDDRCFHLRPRLGWTCGSNERARRYVAMRVPRGHESTSLADDIRLFVRGRPGRPSQRMSGGSAW